MIVIDTPLSGVKIIELKTFGDHRGFFSEKFNHQKLLNLGVSIEVSQINFSYSHPKVLRGLHYQFEKPQAKLVGVTFGRIFDVAVDIRKNSPTYGTYFGTELSQDNHRLLWLPAGFAHGFCVIGDQPAGVMYCVDTPYSPKGESGIHWRDSDIKIDWPVQNPILSDKDLQLPSFAQYQSQPAF